MRSLTFSLVAAGMLGLTALVSGHSASAAPLALSGSAIERTESLATPVQYRARGGRVVRGGAVRGGRVVRGGRYGRGGRGYGYGGGAAAAGLALGVLGAIAVSEAARQNSGCWMERRRIYNRYGEYAGTRRIRVCK